MAKARRKLVFALALVVVAVAALVAVRTLLFRSRQITPAVGAADLSLPARVIERFAAAIRFKTIFGDPAADEEFPRFREFLQRSFPRGHATLAKEIIGGHSLLYSWPGRDANLKPILLMGHLEMHWFHHILLANRRLFEPWLKRELAKSPLTATLIRTTQAATMFHAGMRENILPAQARAVVNFAFSTAIPSTRSKGARGRSSLMPG
jgi:acetylornithine deacetylase/succinyl-diaminopimelate desuccinylase-like protein